MPPVLDPSASKVDGLAFLGLSLTRKSEKGHPDSKTHQTAFDFNKVLDRDYNYIFSSNDDGWLVGGGEPGPPTSYKLEAPDSAHVEILRIGTHRPEWGGLKVEDVIKAIESGHILIPQIEVRPTAVVANGDSPPELEIRFDMEPNTTIREVKEGEKASTKSSKYPYVGDVEEVEMVLEDDEQLPVNWQLRFLHNQLFRYFEFPSRFCPGAFHSTILRKAEFRSEKHRAEYFDMCSEAIEEWRKAGPQPLVPPSWDDFEESKIEVVKSETSSEEYQSGLWLFTDRKNISHYFAPNFLPPYTGSKRRLIVQALSEHWNEKTLSWNPCHVPMVIKRRRGVVVDDEIDAPEDELVPRSPSIESRSMHTPMMSKEEDEWAESHEVEGAAQALQKKVRPQLDEILLARMEDDDDTLPAGSRATKVEPSPLALDSQPTMMHTPLSSQPDHWGENEDFVSKSNKKFARSGKAMPPSMETKEGEKTEDPVETNPIPIKENVVKEVVTKAEDTKKDGSGDRSTTPQTEFIDIAAASSTEKGEIVTASCPKSPTNDTTDVSSDVETKDEASAKNDSKENQEVEPQIVETQGAQQLTVDGSEGDTDSQTQAEKVIEKVCPSSSQEFSEASENGLSRSETKRIDNLAHHSKSSSSNEHFDCPIEKTTSPNETEDKTGLSVQTEDEEAREPSSSSKNNDEDSVSNGDNKLVTSADTTSLDVILEKEKCTVDETAESEGNVKTSEVEEPKPQLQDGNELVEPEIIKTSDPPTQEVDPSSEISSEISPQELISEDHSAVQCPEETRDEALSQTQRSSDSDVEDKANEVQDVKQCHSTATSETVYNDAKDQPLEELNSKANQEKMKPNHVQPYLVPEAVRRAFDIFNGAEKNDTENQNEGKNEGKSGQEEQDFAFEDPSARSLDSDTVEYKDALEDVDHSASCYDDARVEESAVDSKRYQHPMPPMDDKPIALPSLQVVAPNQAQQRSPAQDAMKCVAATQDEMSTIPEGKEDENSTVDSVSVAKRKNTFDDIQVKESVSSTANMCHLSNGAPGSPEEISPEASAQKETIAGKTCPPSDKRYAPKKTFSHDDQSVRSTVSSEEWERAHMKLFDQFQAPSAASASRTQSPLIPDEVDFIKLLEKTAPSTAEEKKNDDDEQGDVTSEYVQSQQTVCGDCGVGNIFDIFSGRN